MHICAAFFGFGETGDGDSDCDVAHGCRRCRRRRRGLLIRNSHVSHTIMFLCAKRERERERELCVCVWQLNFLVSQHQPYT